MLLTEASGGSPAANPEETLDQKIAVFQDRIISVAAGLSTGLYGFGRPGTGKTYYITKTLEQSGVPWQSCSGHVTPGGLFDCFHAYHDRVIFIDDIVKLIKNEQALQVLLAALGTAAGRQAERVITYWRQGKHERVLFTGGVIFASNLEVHRNNELFEAFLSRVHCFNFDLSDEEIMVQMRRIAAQGWVKDGAPESPSLTAEECSEVTEFLIAECRRRSVRLDLRQQVDKAMPDYFLHKVGLSETHWKDLVRMTLEQRVVPLTDTPARSSRRRRSAAELQAIAADIIARHPTPAERTAAWSAQTGTTVRTFYRYAQVVAASTAPPPLAV